MRTEITYTTGENFRWVWQFRDEAGNLIDFDGVSLEVRVTAEVLCVRIPGDAGPDIALALGQGEVSVALTPETLPLPPRLWAYPLELWASWPDGTHDQVIDRGTIYVKENSCA